VASILVYYDAFDKSRLKELAKAFPEYKEWIDGILKRKLLSVLYTMLKKGISYDPNWEEVGHLATAGY
jgi:hypothetical protein